MVSYMKVVLENKGLKGTVVNREALILSYCKNKTVLHLGCADWPYSIEQQQNGALLHEKLHKVIR